MADHEEAAPRRRLARWAIDLIITVATVAVVAGIWYLTVWGFGRESVSTVGMAVPHHLV
jgi:hypothetical protein